MFGWSSAAQAFAASQLGVDTGRYNHQIMLMPPGTPCGSWGSQGMYSPKVWVTFDNPDYFPTAAVLHELGHNFGLQHAGVFGDTKDSQGDNSDIM